MATSSDISQRQSYGISLGREKEAPWKNLVPIAPEAEIMALLEKFVIVISCSSINRNKVGAVDREWRIFVRAF